MTERRKTPKTLLYMAGLFIIVGSFMLIRTASKDKDDVDEVPLVQTSTTTEPLIIRIDPTATSTKPANSKPTKQALCYVGGCSSQICSDKPGVVTTCEFRAEYACYKTAKCERQASGQCGFTETPNLKSCLSNPPAL